MTTFIFSITEQPRKHNNVYATIYRLKHNNPEYIGRFEFSTASMRGYKHEVFNYLMDNGYIPKKYYTSSRCEWRGDGYFFGEVEKFYNIYEI